MNIIEADVMDVFFFVHTSNKVFYVMSVRILAFF